MGIFVAAKVKAFCTSHHETPCEMAVSVASRPQATTASTKAPWSQGQSEPPTVPGHWPQKRFFVRKATHRESSGTCTRELLPGQRRECPAPAANVWNGAEYRSPRSRGSLTRRYFQHEFGVAQIQGFESQEHGRPQS